jgi:hypothetical protein
MADSDALLRLRKAILNVHQHVAMPETSENYWSLFGSDGATSEPQALLEMVFAPLQDPHVDTILQSTIFGRDSYQTLFHPEFGGFGRPVELPTGEMLYFRARCRIGTTVIAPRLFDPLLVDETRELTFVVLAPKAARRSGQFSQLLAYYRPLSNNAPPAHEHIPQSPSRGVAGMNVAPMLLIDRHAPKGKTAAVNGCPALLCGSTTLVDGANACMMSRNKCSDLARGIDHLTLAEWVVGVPRSERRDHAQVVEMSRGDYNEAQKKSADRIEAGLKAIADARAHGPDGLPAETHTAVRPALTCAFGFSDHLALGGFLDALACDAYAGVSLPVFEMPTRFPLYIVACVLLAARPDLARLPTTAASRLEDGACGKRLLQHFYSSTTGIHAGTGVRATAIEAIIEVAGDDVSTAISERSGPLRDMACFQVIVTGANERGETTEDVRSIPRGAEAMRRAGAALLQELYAQPPTVMQDAARAKTQEFLGPDQTTAAVGVVECPIAASLEARDRARGVVGGWLPELQRRLRRSSRSAMQRTLLSLMVEVNQFAESGVFRMRRYAPLNSEADDAGLGERTGLKRNLAACQSLRQDLIAFYSLAAEQLSYMQIPLAYPIRPRTRAKCGICGNGFDPRTLACRLMLTSCNNVKCKAPFCGDCYRSRAATLRHAAGGVPSDDFLISNSGMLSCRKCAPREGGNRR